MLFTRTKLFSSEKQQTTKNIYICRIINLHTASGNAHYVAINILIPSSKKQTLRQFIPSKFNHKHGNKLQSFDSGNNLLQKINISIEVLIKI